MAVYIEDIIEETGGCGRFQVMVSVCVHFAKGLLCFTIIFMMFGGIMPDWWCSDDMNTANVSLVLEEFNASFYKSCSSGMGNATRSCQRLIFDSSVRTIVSEWSLVCDSTWIISTITSIQMAGLFVGNTLGGHSADIIGRKPTFLGTMVANSVLNAIIIFSPSWTVFAVFRFFMGVACGIQLTVMYTIQCEFAPTHWRSLIVAAPSWPPLTMLFALECWILQDWRHIHIASAVLGVVSVIACWFVQESFRWRVAHNQIDKAYKIVKFIAKVNRRPPPAKSEMDTLAENLKRTEKKDLDRKYSLVDLVRNRALFRYSIYLSVTWVCVGLSVYGIQFGMSSLSGSFYVNIVIYSAITLPFVFLLHFLQNSIGRRKTFALYLFVFTISAAAAAVANRFNKSDTRDLVSRICALLAVSVISTAFATMQIMTLEIYPTVVRNIGYGLQNTMARVGSVIGPQLVFLESLFPGMMYIICTILGISSILMLKLLPETKGVNLQDNLFEVKDNKTLEIATECSTKTEDRILEQPLNDTSIYSKTCV